MERRTVSESRSVLVQWMGPSDANAAGFVHGGTVMKLCDEAAATAAIRHERTRVVTAPRAPARRLGGGRPDDVPAARPRRRPPHAARVGERGVAHIDGGRRPRAR